MPVSVQDYQVTNERIRAEAAANRAVSWAGAAEVSTNVFFLDPNGKDEDEERSIFLDQDNEWPITASKIPFKTLKKVIEVIEERKSVDPQAKYTIVANGGKHIVNNPQVIPKDVSLMGFSLRHTIFEAEYPQENMFLVNSGVYVSELRFKGCVADRLFNPTKGAYISFEPGAYITVSPYIQNCTAERFDPSILKFPLEKDKDDKLMGYGSVGMIVDSEVLDPYSPLQSMIVDAYTQVSLNGVGICAKNKSYAQMVSFYTNFTRYGVQALNGAEVTLSNSNTTFGDYGLFADGGREYAYIDTTPVNGTAFPDIGTEMQSGTMKDDVLQAMIVQLDTQYSNSYSSGTRYEELALKDGGRLYDAVAQGMSVAEPALIANFLSGLFKPNPDDGTIQPHFEESILSHFIFSYNVMESEIISRLNSPSQTAQDRITAFFDLARKSLEEIVIYQNPDYIRFFPSKIQSTAHDFSYSGAGCSLLALPHHNGGIGESDLEKRVVQQNGGEVFYSAGDENGDFYVGNEFVIKQREGTIEGRNFNKGVLRLVTGLILSLPK